MSDTPVFNLDPDNSLPILSEWVSLTEAAEMLGVSRQHSYKMAQSYKTVKGKPPIPKERAFKTLHRVGTAHSVVVSRFEVNEMRSKKESGSVSS